MRSRSPIAVGLVGNIALALVIVLAVFSPMLLKNSSTMHYYADFAQDAGLAKGDEVRVSGVAKGNVAATVLHGDRVRVQFTLPKAVTLGTGTRASIRIATLLGRRYVEIEPAGKGRLSDKAVIPLERTSVPFQFHEVENGLQDTTAPLDVDTLTQALKLSATTLAQTPQSLTELLRSLDTVASTVSSHSQAYTSLVNGARTIADLLNGQRGDIVDLLGQGDLILQTLLQRRQVIDAVLQDSATLGQEVTNLLAANEAQLNPLLTRLAQVTTLLQNDRDQLTYTISQLGPASRFLANATGNGPYLDNNSANFIVPPNLLCLTGLVTGCP